MFHPGTERQMLQYNSVTLEKFKKNAVVVYNPSFVIQGVSSNENLRSKMYVFIFLHFSIEKESMSVGMRYVHGMLPGSLVRWFDIFCHRSFVIAAIYVREEDKENSTLSVNDWDRTQVMVKYDF